MRHFIPLALISICGSTMAMASTPEICELWFDSDYYKVWKTTVSDSLCSISLPINELLPGKHYVNLRIADNENRSCTLYRSIFYLFPPEESSDDVQKCKLWFDSDVSAYWEVPVANDVCQSSLSLEGISSGLHFLNMKTIGSKEGGGTLYRSIFYKFQSEESPESDLSCEMWFDSDISSSWKVPVVDGVCQSSPAFEGLSSGLHFINMRTPDSKSGATALYRSPFYISQPIDKCELAGCLTWLDDAVGNALYMPNYDESEAMIVSLDFSHLSSGLHFVSMLPIDSKGHLGTVCRSAFYVSGVECTSIGGYEYWFDDQSESKVTGGSTVTPLQLSLDIKNLTSGHHKLSIRACNSEGDWGKESEIEFFLPLTLDSNEWESLVRLHAKLTSQGWDSPWDISRGPAAVNDFEGLKSNDGHITEIVVNHADIEGELPIEPLEFPYLKKLDFSFNKMEGNAGIYASANKVLSTLDLSNNRISEVNPPLPDAIANVDLSNQTIDKSVVIDLTLQDNLAILDSFPSMFTYDIETRSYKIPSFVVTESSPKDFSFGMEDNFAMTLCFDDGNYEIPFISSQNTYRFPIDSELSLLRLDKEGQIDGTSMRGILKYAMGDANFSGKLTVADIQAAILYIYGNYSTRPFNFTAADTYVDNKITVQDVIRIISMLMTMDYRPEDEIRFRVPVSEIPYDVRVWTEGNEVWLESDQYVAALRLISDGKLDWQLSEYGMDVAENGATMVAYSMSGATLPPGKHRIAITETDASIIYAEVSDELAEDLSVSLQNGSNEVDLLNSDCQQISIFTPDGIKHKTFQKGVNIVKRGEDFSKTIITK